MKDFEVIDLTEVGLANLTAERIVSEVVERFPEKELEIKSKQRMIGELIKNDIEDIDFQALNGLSLPVAVKVNERQGPKRLDVINRRKFCLEFSSIDEETYRKLELVEDAYLVLIGVCDYLSEDSIPILDRFKNDTFVDSQIYDPSDLAKMAKEHFSIDESVTYEIDGLWFTFFGA